MHTRSSSGLRLIAVFEASKGLLVLLAGFGLLSFRHHSAEHFARELVRLSHLDPLSHYPHIFIELSRNVSSGQLWLGAGMAFVYAAVRLAEAYGLWHERHWAEWFAAASGGIYLPLEIHELAHGVSWIKLTTFIFNVSIVAYMIYILRQQKKRRLHEANP